MQTHHRFAKIGTYRFWEVFKDFAKAVQPYIETSTFDEGRIVEIVDDRVNKNVLRPVEVNINGKSTAKLGGFVPAEPYPPTGRIFIGKLPPWHKHGNQYNKNRES